MKKQILLFLALIMSSVAFAQVTIQMEKDGGVYKVPCTVNGVKMKFIFDTGAATVSMSQTMAQFLLDGEYLSTTDIKGIGKSVLADGSIVNHAVVNLRDVEIGGMHIHNIEATVIEGQNAPLLLGQTAISELGRVTIDGNRLVIHAADKELTQKQIDQLEKQAYRCLENDNYAVAIECFVEIDEANGLSKEALKNLCYCYLLNHSYSECIQSCKRWLQKYEDMADSVDKHSIYNFLGGSYDYGFDDYDKALLWYQKELDVFLNSALSDYYSDETGLYESLLADINLRIANCYYNKCEFYRAVPYYKQAIKSQCQSIGVTMEEVQNGKVQDHFLGNYLYDYAFCYYKQNKNVDGDEVMKMAALCGDQNAVDFCRKYNINYQTKSSKLFD